MRILWVSLVTIIVDQLAKWVIVRHLKPDMDRTVSIIGDWLRLTYTENPGMAFGISFGPDGLVTVLSIFATGLIVFYLYTVRNTDVLYRGSLAFILGGALGNIVDRVFYGAFYYGQPLFTGRVVDFIHVNVWRGYVPEGVPFVGGSYLALFPIWNVADMAIVLGVLGILLFQHRQQPKTEATAAETRFEESPSASAEAQATTEL